MTRWLLPAVGAAAIAAAWWQQGSVAGALAWVIATVVAAAGVGRLVERGARIQLQPALAVASGLATMLVVALVLARIGFLAWWTQVGFVIAGVGLTAVIAPSPVVIPRGSLLGVIASLIVVAIAISCLETPVVDGVNHVLAVKHLWDTGAMPSLPHAAGLAVVGEAVFSFGGGAEYAGLFDAVAAVLVIAVAVEELGTSDSDHARLVLAIIILAIVLEPASTGGYPMALFHLGAIVALRASTGSRVAWHALGFALALALIRHELAYLAIPYAIAALLLHRVSRPRALVLALVAVVVAIASVQLAAGAPPAAALVKSIPVVLALPVALVLARVLGSFDIRSPFGVMCLATATYVLALVTYAIHPAHHAGAASFATWFAAAAAILIAATSSLPQIHTASASLVLALLATVSLVLPLYTLRETERLLLRFAVGLSAMRERLTSDAAAAHEQVRAAQLQLPAGSAIAFWGRSAARLDFERNAIRDVSATDGRFLVPIETDRLAGLDYLVVEDLAVTPRRKRKEPPIYVPALSNVSDRITLERSSGVVRVFRVKN